MAYVFQKYPENLACHLYTVLPMNFATFLKGGLVFIKTRIAKNAIISVFVICVEAIIYLLLYKLHDCTFKDH